MYDHRYFEEKQAVQWYVTSCVCLEGHRQAPAQRRARGYAMALRPPREGKLPRNRKMCRCAQLVYHHPQPHSI